jgi:serine/threonine protein kinase
MPHLAEVLDREIFAHGGIIKLESEGAAHVACCKFELLVFSTLFMSHTSANPGFTAPDPAELAPLFPGYDVQSLIAAGGMGAVYCAVQKSLDRMVAIKILPAELSKDLAFRAGFEAEAKAMARLNHPNLIGVFDFGEVSGMLYIIMEFVPGKSVYHSAYGIAVDQAEVIRLVSGICHGLAHAHENGIIHRDIKPSNVLLDLSAQPKIGDFGLARPMDSTIQEGDEIFGTPHYTAPEVVENPHAVDYRADIFSVGVLLHELLTSKLPADDPRPASMIIRCDPRFDAIIRRATQHQPGARYLSAAEMAKELHDIGTTLGQLPAPILQQTPVIPPTYQSSTPRKNVSEPSSSSNAILLVVAALAGIAAWFYFTGKKSESAPLPKPAVEISAQPTNNTEPTKKPATAITQEPSTARETITPAQTPPPTALKPEPTNKKSGSSLTPPEVVTPKEPTPPAEPKTSDSPAPRADVPAFFTKAKTIMQDKAKPLITTHRASLNSNCSAFGLSLISDAAKLKTGAADAKKSIEATITGWRNDNGRIPKELPDNLATMPTAAALLDLYRQKQTGIDNVIHRGLDAQSATYILGLEKQIERYKADKDTGAVALLEQEIEKTKASSKHYYRVILGPDPEGGDEEE